MSGLDTHANTVGFRRVLGLFVVSFKLCVVFFLLAGVWPAKKTWPNCKRIGGHPDNKNNSIERHCALLCSLVDVNGRGLLFVQSFCPVSKKTL